MGTRKPSAAQIKAAEARRSELLGKLSDGIGKLCDSAEWQRYLDVQAKFHHYSFANTMLILCQRPDATRVMKYGNAEKGTGWQGLGRQVRAGESAIRIWAPRGISKAEKEAEKEAQEGEQTLAPPMRFTLVPVFDVSQTEGPELPEPVKLLDGQDEQGVFGKLEKVAESIGYTVEVTPEIDGHEGANGLCEYGHRKLTVAGNRSPLQQVKSLTHEIGHALLHEPDADGQRDISRGQCELEAESTAYVVCQSLGLDTSGYSFGYVAGWQSGDPKKAQEQIKQSGKRISGASKKICDGLEAQAEAEVTVPEETTPEPLTPCSTVGKLPLPEVPVVVAEPSRELELA